MLNLSQRIKRILVIGGSAILLTIIGSGWYLYANRMVVYASSKPVSIVMESNIPYYDIPAGTTYSWMNAVPIMTDDVHYNWVNGRPYVIITASFSGNISNTPTSKAFGVVDVSSSYYANGSAPANPVVDGNCAFTITNAGSLCDLDMRITNFTGGVGWTIVSGVPSTDQARVTAYWSGENPAAGLVLSNTDQEFKDSIAASSTLKWDFKLDTASSFTDGAAKSATLTITARAHS